MKNQQNLVRILLGKAAAWLLLPVLFFASSVLHAQTADVRYAGVFYKDGTATSTNQEMYCDYLNTSNSGLSKFRLKLGLGASTYTVSTSWSGFGAVDCCSSTSCSSGSPISPDVLPTQAWIENRRYANNSIHAVNDIFIDGDYLVQLIAVGSRNCPPGNKTYTTGSSFNQYDIFCSNSYRLGIYSTTTAAGTRCQSSVSFYDVYQIIGYAAGMPSDSYSIAIDKDVSKAPANRSFIFDPTPKSSETNGAVPTNDPWVSSALIEYDQPAPRSVPSENKYPNHCLALCMNVMCNNLPMSMSTYSIAFPLQKVKFDIVKYYNNRNIASEEDAPAVRTIDLYPDPTSSQCGSYTCPGEPTSGQVCSSAEYEMIGNTCYILGTDTVVSADTCKCKDSVCNYVKFSGTGTRTNRAIPFCAAWDGSYEISGEFGKRNGQYGFRATVNTDVPGDNIITDEISFSSTIAYPGENQIPIQVDVTNIHMVRSTPTVVGKITSVTAQPYTYSYQISKDAEVRIVIEDASTYDSTQYLQGDTTDYIVNPTNIVRTLVDWQPRNGEGMIGNEKDQELTAFDSWDGRNDNGLFLPAGNYIAAIQAKTADEWKGVDFSRAVTRQLSLDPLQITDVQLMPLNTQSTAFAAISYVLTEGATLYWQIYTPGTTFNVTTNTPGSLLTDSSAQVGTAPALVTGTGTLVYEVVEARAGRTTFIEKWDGLCHNVNGCTITYPEGATLSDMTKCTTSGGCTESFNYMAPMPDGDYVYVLWAEIPYNGKYVNARGGGGTPGFTAGGTCSGTDEINGQCFTAVKTLKYTTGIIAVERGNVDVTMQPVSYSTIGSSPTAYGLNPFMFKYALSRNANAVAYVANTAGLPVKYLTSPDGDVHVAQQMNTLTWNGLDDKGRAVMPGTYMFVVETKDAMFPAKTNHATVIFPVDMYRIVDVRTTDVYGDSDARATISFLLNKPMYITIPIYNKDVIIPDYGVVQSSVSSATTSVTSVTAGAVSITVAINGVSHTFTNGKTLSTYGEGAGVSRVDVEMVGGTSYKLEWHSQVVTPGSSYNVWVSVYETSGMSEKPRVCDRTTDSAIFTSATGPVDPANVTREHKCIYVNDSTFTNYPGTKTYFDDTTLDIRLKPIKTFEETTMRPGEGVMNTVEWDALYFTNPVSGGYEMVPDGQYPFFILGTAKEGYDRYYAQAGDASVPGTYLPEAPFTNASDVVAEDIIYATDRPVGKINVTRGAVYFLENSVVVFPNAPQLFNVSTGPIFIPPYEINFAISRAARVEIDIVALEDNVCTPLGATSDAKLNSVGYVCRHLDPITYQGAADNFDPNIIRKMYWDGRDDNGYYVKPSIYEVRLKAINYPETPKLYEDTIKSVALNADLLKVFDLLEADGYSIAQRNTDMTIGYQISVPMKVALQIFKPGTTIFNYQKGTLRNPTTGQEVTDINEVLVRSIVGIRPATTLIEEVWDGTDYAHQEVPDGTYPFRFVTALNSADIDTITGEIVNPDADDTSLLSSKWKINWVADTSEYQTLHNATIAIGDGTMVCSDWEKTVFFYPNPLTDASKGTLEITKLPVPGTMSLKFFNLAGDLVRDSGYTCVDANNFEVTMGNTLTFNPDNTPDGSVRMTAADLAAFPNVRNAALRCRWDRTNQHGKKVARGVYFGLVDFKAQNGREHCQKVVKILVP